MGLAVILAVRQTEARAGTTLVAQPNLRCRAQPSFFARAAERREFLLVSGYSLSMIRRWPVGVGH